MRRYNSGQVNFQERLKDRFKRQLEIGMRYFELTAVFYRNLGKPLFSWAFSNKRRTGGYVTKWKKSVHICARCLLYHYRIELTLEFHDTIPISDSVWWYCTGKASTCWDCRTTQGNIGTWKINNWFARAFYWHGCSRHFTGKNNLIGCLTVQS